MTRSTLALAAALLLASLAGCASPAAHDHPTSAPSSAAVAPTAPAATVYTIAVGGSSGALSSIEVAARAFEASHPDDKVVLVFGMGSSGSVKSLIDGQIDLAVTSRPLKGDELEHDLTQELYHHEGIMFYVDRATGVTALTSDELAGLYSGRYQSWKDIGGNDLPVLVVSREADDSETERAIEKWPALDTPWGATVRVVDDDVAKLELTRSTPGASAFLDATAASLVAPGLVPVEIDGDGFDAQAIRSGDAPLAFSYYLISTPDQSGPAREFADFLLGSEWQGALEAALSG